MIQGTFREASVTTTCCASPHLLLATDGDRGDSLVVPYLPLAHGAVRPADHARAFAAALKLAARAGWPAADLYLQVLGRRECDGVPYYAAGPVFDHGEALEVVAGQLAVVVEPEPAPAGEADARKAA